MTDMSAEAAVAVVGMVSTFLIGWGAIWAKLSNIERILPMVERHERRLTRMEQAHADRSGDKCALKSSDL